MSSTSSPPPGAKAAANPGRFYAPDSFSPYLTNEDKDAEYAAPSAEPTKYVDKPGSIYRSISWIFGFKDQYSLLNCFIFSGALIGFCLGRAATMDPAKAASVAGERFWFRQPLYKINLFLHIYLTTLGGICAVVQFLPVVRRRKMLLHRVNGYGVLFTLVVGNICGAIIARRSLGGELNVQSAYYTLGIIIVFSGILGIYNVKRDTRKHRRWMLRMVVYTAAAITARLTMLAAREIISIIGTYYAIWRCDELLWAMSDLEEVGRLWPQCAEPDINPGAVWVAVHASTRAGPVEEASSVRACLGMAVWIAVLIHVVGAEIYLAKTNSSNQVRLGYVLEPLEYTEDSKAYY